MELTHIHRISADYPGSVERHLQANAPETLAVVGRLSILKERKVALFCSQSCPGDLASEAYDVAQHLRDMGVTVVSGFHSPMEAECLKVLLSSPHPVIVGFGRALEGARLPSAYDRPLKEGRLLILSPFGQGIDRVTQETARTRNLFLAALADQVFVAYANPESNTEQFCRKVLAWGKTLYTLDGGRNQGIVDLGAIPIEPGTVRHLLR